MKAKREEKNRQKYGARSWQVAITPSSAAAALKSIANYLLYNIIFLLIAFSCFFIGEIFPNRQSLKRSNFKRKKDIPNIQT